MKFCLITLGCPKNQVDSEMMARLLVDAGHQAVAEPTSADVVIVNTCAFVHDARDESLDTLEQVAGQLRTDQHLIAAGCFPQRDARQICRRVPRVDGLLGTRSWAQIVEVVEQVAAGDGTRRIQHVAEGNLVASVARTALTGPTAYLKIADGCDAHCAFCAIPAIKGPQVSKPLEEVLREARELVDQGVLELVLIAQDTTAWGRDLGVHDGLPLLLEHLARIMPAEGWIRILYAYPQHVSDALVATMAGLPQVCHYLDMPLQHGHSQVLRRMRRPHDVETIHGRIAALRAAMPDIALRSTFIVGFPGETDDEFATLMHMLDEIAFDHVGVFTYSRERGTPAAEMADQVPGKIAQRRYHQMMVRQQDISLARNRALLGRELTVLVDENQEGYAVGRSYRDAPEIDGSVLIPSAAPLQGLVRVRITEAQPYDLLAELVGGSRSG
ncbi:MAG: 30S ribosomal protein S12 methylthiotransferase RimO [Anaerolineae bacterium]|jgi:ribosomal protein S12 methylthiotransferase